MLNLECTMLLVPHVEAEPRSYWTRNHDERPLRDLGMERAAGLANDVGRVDAVYSSPALRCVQTVEPLARASGVSIVRLDGLREASATTHHETWQWWLDERMVTAVSAAAVAGRMLRALAELGVKHRTGRRIAVCSHGDSIPIVVACVAAAMEVALPQPCDYGGWYEIAPARVQSMGRLLARPT